MSLRGSAISQAPAESSVFRVVNRLVTSFGAFARAKPLGTAGLVLILLLVIVSLVDFFMESFGVRGDETLTQFSPVKTNLTARLESPSSTHFFGTDNLGRDQFSRIVHGIRPAMFVSFASVVAGVAVGSLIGLVSGFWSGPFDLIVQRFMDAVMAMPALIMALALVAVLGPGDLNVAMAIGFITIPFANRLIRATVLSLKEEVYVEAARALGASDARVMGRHITPNMMASVLVLTTNQFASALVIAASLSFLGIGSPPPEPSWGGMLNVGVTQFATLAPWLAVSTGIVIFITILGFIMVGDAIRDVLDPRLRVGGVGPQAT